MIKPRTAAGSRAAGSTRRLSSDILVLVGIFAVSRLALRALGLQFEVGLLKAAVQNVDPALLRTHLLQSLWYMHGQPPLWNALIGLTLQVAPGHVAPIWHLAFLGLGLVEILALYALLLELGTPGRPAAAVAAVFSLSPAVLLYENSFFYDYPTLVAVTLAALAAARFARSPSTGRGLAFSVAAAYLVLTRTLFQVWWLALGAGVLLVACRAGRRTLLAALAIPLALVLAVYVKNEVLYGVPSTTSWTGMGLARSAVMALPLSERRELVARGVLHPVSLVKPLAPLAAYEAVGVSLHPPTGIPLLDEAKGPEVDRNLENRTYVEISRQYLSDDLWVMRHRTGAYLRGVGRGFADFFTSPTVAWGGQGDEAPIRRYDLLFRDAVYGRLGPGKVGLFVVAAYVLAVAFGLWVTVRRLRPGCDAVTTTIAFSTVTILYVTLVGNFAEVGENFRFRFVVDPLALALCTVAARRGFNAVRARRVR